jgi:hypothetical protein
MNMRKIAITTFFAGLLLITLALFGCSAKAENSIEDEMNKKEESKVKVSKEEIDQLIQSFPSPIETSIIIKNAGNEFSSELLIPTKKLDRFVSSYDKAIAMGAFGGDMGYINIYGKSFVAIDYLAAIRLLSVDLEIDRFFDFEDMIKMAKSSDNIDSLQRMSTESFNNMEKYLREKGRNELSVLIVFGTWLEGAYIVSDIAKGNMSEEMKNRVAEQKESVNKINEILVSASGDKYFANLLRQLKPLVEMYEKIKIETIMREPEMKEVDGQLVFIDNSETKIITPKGIVESIITETVKLRNELLK